MPEDQQRETDELARIDAQIPVAPSIWQARRTFLAGIRVLEDLVPGATGAALHDIQRTLVISGREFLQAEIRELHTGDTPKDIQKHAQGLPAGARKDALLVLAGRLVTYQHGLERDAPESIGDPSGEARELTESVGQLRPHIRLLTRVKGLFGV